MSKPFLTHPILFPSWHILTSHDPSWHVLNIPVHSWPVLTCRNLSWPVVTSPDHSWPVLIFPDHDQSWSFLTSPDHPWPVLIIPGHTKAKCESVSLWVRESVTEHLKKEENFLGGMPMRARQNREKSVLLHCLFLTKRHFWKKVTESVFNFWTTLWQLKATF